jgi:hypothetical protein
MKRENLRKCKSFSSLGGTRKANTTLPSQIRQIGRPPHSNARKQPNARDRSFSDSESSESSCLEKKYYRCGCLSHTQGCHNQYRDYLSEIREERLRKKEKSSNPFNF